MRILTAEELIESGQEDMAELSVIFNHPIVAEMEGKTNPQEVWRWQEMLTKGTRIQNFLDVGNSLNQLIVAVKCKQMFSLEEFMRYNMQDNHSLCFLAECFAQGEVTEFGLKYLSSPPEDWNFDEEYWQTPIDYIREKYKGQILEFAEDGQVKTPT